MYREHGDDILRPVYSSRHQELVQPSHVTPQPLGIFLLIVSDLLISVFL